MIKIRKNTTNENITLTLTEKSDISSPVYLFQFTHDLTFEVKNFTCADESVQTARYNLFTIVESTTENLSAGQVTLKKGFHSYKIYEAEVDSPQELDPDNYSPSLNIVEEGKVFVYENETELPTFDDSGVQTEIPTFQG